MGHPTKAGSKSEGPKNFPAAPFFEHFLQLGAEKKYSKNGAAGKFFGPSYFDPALIELQNAPLTYIFSLVSKYYAVNLIYFTSMEVKWSSKVKETRAF